jgi:hypothetical protein
MGHEIKTTLLCNVRCGSSLHMFSVSSLICAHPFSFPSSSRTRLHHAKFTVENDKALEIDRAGSIKRSRLPLPADRRSKYHSATQRLACMHTCDIMAWPHGTVSLTKIPLVELYTDYDG